MMKCGEVPPFTQSRALLSQVSARSECFLTGYRRFLRLLSQGELYHVLLRRAVREDLMDEHRLMVERSITVVLSGSVEVSQ